MTINRFFRIAALAGLAAVVFVTISPIGLRPGDPLSVDVDRAAAFAILALLWVLAYPERWRLVGLGIVVSTGALELAQGLSPTRHAHLGDALVKVLGALIGVALGWAFHRFRRGKLDARPADPQR